MGKDNLCGHLNIYIEWAPMRGSYLCNLVILGGLMSSDGFGNISSLGFANRFKYFSKIRAHFVLFLQ